MSKPFLMHACAALALMAMSPAALAQTNTADPTLNTTTTNTADPLAANTMTTDPLAGDGIATTSDPMITDPSMNATEEEDDDDFPWGLLGLLGLAGLLGLKRRDRDDDVRVDRTNTRGTSDRM